MACACRNEKIAPRHALPAPDSEHRALRRQAHVAVDRDVAVENRTFASLTANARAAVHHSDLDGRETCIPIPGWRARPHGPQPYRRLSAFGLPEPEADRYPDAMFFRGNLCA